MAVTPEMIDALFEQQPNFEQVHATTGREHARVPFRGRAAAVVFAPPSAPHAEPLESEVVTTDISRGGLSLLHRKELHPGQEVLLQLSRGSCTVEVCWCCRVWSGLYIAGCRFIDASFTDALS